MTPPNPPVTPADPAVTPPEPDAETFRDLVTTMRDAVVGMDLDGSIRYCNPAAGALLGYTGDQLLGRNVAELIHPDDLLRAGEVLTLIGGDREGAHALNPAMYRVRRADGSYRSIEFISGPVDSSGLAPVVIVGRWSADEHLHRKLLETLTSGAPIEDALELVPEFARWRYPADRYALVVTEPGGTRRRFGDKLPSVLAGDLRGSSDTPAERARRSGESIIATLDELPVEMEAAAIAEDLGSCWMHPVADPLAGEPALIVQWFAAGGPPPEMHRYSLAVMEQVLTLVLQWRHQLHDLHLAARHDALTGLPNRTSFFAALEGPGTGARTAVLYLDLDSFKPVNDEYGHAAGDAVLIETGRRITEVVRPTDVVARLGGDEFAVLCPGVDGEEEAAAIAERVVTAVRAPVVVAGARIEVGVSVGVAVTDRRPGEWLVDAADRALYEVKGSGKGAWRLAPGA